MKCHVITRNRYKVNRLRAVDTGLLYLQVIPIVTVIVYGNSCQKK